MVANFYAERFGKGSGVIVDDLIVGALFEGKYGRYRGGRR
jgi:hypothetical protein